MKLTRRMINRFRFHGRMDINDELEAFLLRQYGAEPYPNVYTEQDLHEQVRKIVFQHNRDKSAILQAF